MIQTLENPRARVETFLKAKEEFKEGVRLIGDVILVEAMPEPEIKKGSIIVSSGNTKALDGITANLPIFVRVLLVGPGYYNEETGADVPLEIKAGNIIQVGRQAVDFFGAFGSILRGKDTGVGITRSDAARIVFENDETYNSFFESISK